MKKIIVLLTTIISLNLFGGVLHPDVDMRVIGKIGADTIVIPFPYSSFNYGVDAQIKGDVHKSDDFNTYLGGKVDFRISNMYDHITINSHSYSVVPSGFIGFEESFKDLKFYQQLELGLGYKYREIVGGNYHVGIFSPGVQLGVNYKNILFTLDTKPEIEFPSKMSGLNYNVDVVFQLGIGYEF